MRKRLPQHLSEVPTSWDAASSREALLGHLASAIQRINELERHLVGVATLASAGWAFIHKDLAPDDLGRVIFATMFAGLVASSYNALYLARSAVNRRLIEIEQLLGFGYAPYLQTLKSLGGPAASVVYLSTAMFIPLMAAVSLAVCATTLVKHGPGELIWLAWGLWGISATVVVWTSRVNLKGLKMVAGIAKRLLGDAK